MEGPPSQPPGGRSWGAGGGPAAPAPFQGCPCLQRPSNGRPSTQQDLPRALPHSRWWAYNFRITALEVLSVLGVTHEPSTSAPPSRTPAGHLVLF